MFYRLTYLSYINILPCKCDFKTCWDCYVNAVKAGGVCPGYKEPYKNADLDENAMENVASLSLPPSRGIPTMDRRSSSKMERGLSPMNSTKSALVRSQTGDFDHDRWLFEGTYGYENAIWPKDEGSKTMEPLNKPWSPLTRKLKIPTGFISPYRNRIQEVAGTANYSHKRSGIMLPPPVDEHFNEQSSPTEETVVNICTKVSACAIGNSADGLAFPEIKDGAVRPSKQMTTFVASIGHSCSSGSDKNGNSFEEEKILNLRSDLSSTHIDRRTLVEADNSGSHLNNSSSSQVVNGLSPKGQFFDKPQYNGAPQYNAARAPSLAPPGYLASKPPGLCSSGATGQIVSAISGDHLTKMPIPNNHYQTPSIANVRSQPTPSGLNYNSCLETYLLSSYASQPQNAFMDFSTSRFRMQQSASETETRNSPRPAYNPHCPLYGSRVTRAASLVV